MEVLVYEVFVFFYFFFLKLSWQNALQIQGGTTQTMVILGSAPNMKTYLGFDFSQLNTNTR